MDVGIGLPNAVPDTDGSVLADWAQRAEEGGFSTLGTIGRLAFPSYDDLIALAAAAAVTERIRLTTSVLLGPLYTNVVLLAKQTASLDRLSHGRFVLGIGLGGREDDYTASGVPTAGRGRRLEAQLQEIKQIWARASRGEPGAIGPPPVREGGPEVIVGGNGELSFRRAARFGDGWIMGGGSPEMFAEAAAGVDRAWKEAGRSGRPAQAVARVLRPRLAGPRGSRRLPEALLRMAGRRRRRPDRGQRGGEPGHGPRLPRRVRAERLRRAHLHSLLP